MQTVNHDDFESPRSSTTHSSMKAFRPTLPSLKLNRLDQGQQDGQHQLLDHHHCLVQKQLLPDKDESAYEGHVNYQDHSSFKDPPSFRDRPSYSRTVYMRSPERKQEVFLCWSEPSADFIIAEVQISSRQTKGKSHTTRSSFSSKPKEEKVCSEQAISASPSTRASVF